MRNDTSFWEYAKNSNVGCKDIIKFSKPELRCTSHDHATVKNLETSNYNIPTFRTSICVLQIYSFKLESHHVNTTSLIQIHMKVARIVKLNEPLQVQELQTPAPKGTQVLIKILSSGVCHSDVHVWQGYYEGIDGQPLKTTDRGVKYPLTPGHEIAGTVENLGEQAEGFSKNERVLLYPWIGEGLCPACRIGQENLCDKP